MNLWVNWHLCSFVACTITHLYMGNSTAFFTTNNSSEERGTTTRALDTLNTRTDGFLQILLMWCAMSPKLKYSTVRPPVCVLIFGTNLHFSAFKLCSSETMHSRHHVMPLQSEIFSPLQGSWYMVSATYCDADLNCNRHMLYCSLQAAQFAVSNTLMLLVHKYYNK